VVSDYSDAAPTIWSVPTLLPVCVTVANLAIPAPSRHTLSLSPHSQNLPSARAVLQCAAACCSVCCSVLECVLQCVGVCVGVCCSVLECVLQCVGVCVAVCWSESKQSRGTYKKERILRHMLSTSSPRVVAFDAKYSRAMLGS